MQEQYKPGDVFQITEPARAGWTGAFVLATEITSWGIVGFVAMIENHDKQNQAYIRLPWSDVSYVGAAAIVPAEVTAESAALSSPR
jgi:hypothetical protein